MTVAGSSPWCCCGRQRKTSLGETGDTKGEYDMRRTKNRREGACKKVGFAGIDSGECMCVTQRKRESVKVTNYSGTCRRFQVN